MSEVEGGRVSVKNHVCSGAKSRRCKYVGSQCTSLLCLILMMCLEEAVFTSVQVYLAVSGSKQCPPLLRDLLVKEELSALSPVAVCL